MLPICILSLPHVTSSTILHRFIGGTVQEELTALDKAGLYSE